MMPKTLAVALIAAWVVGGPERAAMHLRALDAGAPAGALLLEGARVITGDGAAPIQDAAILVRDGRVEKVGPSTGIKAPAAAERRGVRGKTIIPALVDGHVHFGYQVGLTFSPDNYTRATLVDQLNRYAYAGIGAVLSMGTDPGDLPFQLRADQGAGRVGGARFLTAGRGIAAPNAGPAMPELKASALGVETEAEARRAVREQVARRVDVVKIWVDDRNGTVKKLSPDLYRAVIDEAHKHRTRVVAHIFYLDDAKELARAGVDAFAHMVRDREIDDELIELMKQHRVLAMPNIAISENAAYASPPDWLNDPLLHEVVPEDEISRVRESFARRTPEAVERAQRTVKLMLRNLAKMKDAGVTIGLGTDDGAVRDHFYAFTAHRELRLMRAAGRTPLQVLTAATRTTADFLGLRDQGSIRAGQWADFVVLDGNPLDDIANTTRIADVYRHGDRLDRAAMRAAFR